PIGGKLEPHFLVERADDLVRHLAAAFRVRAILVRLVRHRLTPYWAMSDDALCSKRPRSIFRRPLRWVACSMVRKADCPRPARVALHRAESQAGIPCRTFRRANHTGALFRSAHCMARRV